MTQTQIHFISTASISLACTLWFLPVWLSGSLLTGLALITTWSFRSQIIKKIPKQFIKEFSAMTLTLTLCAVWFWQLKHWLPALV